MPPIKILCTADLHIGRSSATEMASAEVDFSAQGAWKRLVDIAIAEQADAVAIAGDIFDGSAAAQQTRRKFCAEARRLKDANIPLVVVAGNHDHDALRACLKAFPDTGIVLLGDKSWEVRTIETGNGDVNFLGWSFRAQEHRGSPFSEPMPTLPEGVVIGLLHCDIGQGSHYAPVELLSLAGKGTAWLLGHIHKPQNLNTGTVPSCYPGSPQALDFGETGSHGFRWLDIDASGAKFRPLTPLSLVCYEYADIDVNWDNDEDPTSAYERALDSRATSMLADMPLDSYLCLRVRAQCRFPRHSNGLIAMESPSSYNRYEAELMSSSRVPDMETVWTYANQPDALGQASRLLLALSDEDAGADHVLLPEWRQRAETLVKATADLYKRVLLRLVQPLDAVLLEGPEATADEDATLHARFVLLTEARDLVDTLSKPMNGIIQ